MKLEDTYIYKYCTLETGELIAISRLLKFNNPSFFNDPFDCDINLLKFDFSECCEEVLHDLEEVRNLSQANYDFDISNHLNDVLTSENIQDIYRRGQIDKIEKSSISCFSLNPSNMTMWSHYADKHKGVCLVFDIGIGCFLEDKLLWDRINMNLVRYDDLKPANYLKSKQEGINNLFFFKSKDWAYEEEWRIFILENIRYLRFKMEFLKGVIFGANVTDAEIERFKKNLSSEDLMRLDYARFRKEELELKFEDI